MLILVLPSGPNTRVLTAGRVHQDISEKYLYLSATSVFTMSGKKKSHQTQSAHNLYIFGELLLCFVFVVSVHSGFTVFSLCVYVSGFTRKDLKLK